MNVATINRVLRVNFNQKPTLAALTALTVSVTQPPHIRNSAKELIRGKRYVLP